MKKSDNQKKLARFHELLSQGSLGLLQDTGKIDSLAHCDIRDLNDIQAVAEVAADCTRHMLATESQWMTGCCLPAF